jgi:hypothetical protein
VGRTVHVSPDAFATPTKGIRVLLPYALALGEARSYLAALADRALTFDACVEYERILLQLDHLHGDVIPGTASVPADSRDALFDVAYAAIEELASHGVDLLAVELLLDMLESARSTDLP